jgi:hypothetical protein
MTVTPSSLAQGCACRGSQPATPQKVLRISSVHPATGDATPSDGARQSPRGERLAAAETFGPLGMAERLNWLIWKKRNRNVSSQRRDRIEIVALRASAGKSTGHSPASASCHACHARKAIFVGARPWRTYNAGRNRAVRTDRSSTACSGSRPIASGRDQLGRDFRAEDRGQHAIGIGIELAGLDRPADQELDQRLRHAGIDRVMAHLIADAIGAPAQSQFGQIASADHEAVALIGEAEEIIGAQARLHILERDVIDGLAPARRDGPCP